MTPPTGSRWQQQGDPVDPWSALSLLISGVLMWGAIGWGVSQWLGSRAWMGAGVLVGGVLGVWCVYLRYGREPSGPPETGGPVAFHGTLRAETPADPGFPAPLVASTLPTPQRTQEEDTP